MKIAIGFYGLVGGKIGKNGIGESLDPKEAFDFYSENVFDKKHSIDKFIHTWSVEHKEKLESLYKPINSIYQEQLKFPESRYHPEVIEFERKLSLKKLFFKSKFNLQLDNLKKNSFRAFSRWYSNKKVLDLIRSYEIENNFKYDFVLITRLDLGFFKKLDFNELDSKTFYAGYRNNVPNKKNNFKGDCKNEFSDLEFNDLWFISSSDNMNKFSKLFNEIFKYNISPHRSSYQHTTNFVKPKRIEYFLYRWFDFELIRRKFHEAIK